MITGGSAAYWHFSASCGRKQRLPAATNTMFNILIAVLPAAYPYREVDLKKSRAAILGSFTGSIPGSRYDDMQCHDTTIQKAIHSRAITDLGSDNLPHLRQGGNRDHQIIFMDTLVFHAFK